MLQPTVSVVIPARDEARTIGGIVRALSELRPAVYEVVVVDDGSADETAAIAAACGARVVTAGAVLAEWAAGPGKGQAMWKGLASTTGEVVVFCDGDLEHFDATYVPALVSGLAGTAGATLAKARYERTGTGGRVNELVARPVLELLHPHLAHVAQPLGGEYAAWRHVLAQVSFVHGYGVDMALLLDITHRFGAESVVEVDLGPRGHRNRPLAELRPQARDVLEVALSRAGVVAARIPHTPPLAEVERSARETA